MSASPPLVSTPAGWRSTVVLIRTPLPKLSITGLLRTFITQLHAGILFQPKVFRLKHWLFLLHHPGRALSFELPCLAFVDVNANLARSRIQNSLSGLCKWRDPNNGLNTRYVE